MRAALRSVSSLVPDKVIIVTGNHSGGSVPVWGTKDGRYPASVVVHELLHSYGLADEYEYPDSEARTYCSRRFQVN